MSDPPPTEPPAPRPSFRRVWVAAGVVLFAILVQVPGVRRAGNVAPTIGDAIEWHNIAWSLASGHGFGFDWDDPAWRQAATDGGVPDVLLARRGAGPTAYRPPLVSLLGIPLIRWFPDHSFAAWRWLELAMVALAAGLTAWAVATFAGNAAAGALAGALVAIDPLRRITAPNGWMSEGVSVLLVAAFVALLVIAWTRRDAAAPGRRRGIILTLLGIGAVIGLMMLARSTFIPIAPLFALLAAWITSPPGTGRRTIVRRVAVALIAACVVAAPWWVRNVVLLDDLAPFGTQGGINLPDQYGDVVWQSQGRWTGLGIINVWQDTYGDEWLRPILGPDGFPSTEYLENLAGGGPRAPAGWFIYGFSSGNIALEQAMARHGTAAAVGWVVDNWPYLPAGMWMKLVSEVRPVAWVVVPAMAVALLTFTRRWRGSDAWPVIVAMWLVLAGAAGMVMITHAVGGRFLVPFTPALYSLAAAGASAMWTARRRAGRRTT